MLCSCLEHNGELQDGGLQRDHNLQVVHRACWLGLYALQDHGSKMLHRDVYKLHYAGWGGSGLRRWACGGRECAPDGS